MDNCSTAAWHHGWSPLPVPKKGGRVAVPGASDGRRKSNLPAAARHWHCLHDQQSECTLSGLRIDAGNKPAHSVAHACIPLPVCRHHHFYGFSCQGDAYRLVLRACSASTVRPWIAGPVFLCCWEGEVSLCTKVPCRLRARARWRGKFQPVTLLGPPRTAAARA